MRRSRGEEGIEFIPDVKGDTLAIPFMERGVDVNCKYRWAENGERRFMQRKGGKKTFYNADVLLNEEMLRELETGMFDLIWVEGEPDCLAAIDAGFPHTISVPDGAPPGRDKNGKIIHVPDDDRDIDPEDDDKFSFIGSFFEELSRVQTHLILTDNDDSGRRLAKEIVRRLGAARCRWSEYPKDEVVPDKKSRGKLRACKDLNEVLKHLGPDAVRQMVENSKPWPVKGLFRLSDYPEMDVPVMCETKISPRLDDMMKFYAGQFIVMTGVPNVGKSTFMNQVSVALADIHGWKQSIFSGEKAVKPFLARELMGLYAKKDFGDMDAAQRADAEAFVEKHYSFIDYDPMDDEIEINIDFVIDKAEAAVFRYGIKMLIIDPWNELEHKRPNGQSLTEYVGDSIRKLKRFGKQFDCAVAVVAHPTKFDHGGVPGLYNISDSAHWANKADLGVVVHAEDPAAPDRIIDIPKVRLKRIAGNVGQVPLTFDTKTGRFKKPDF